MVLLYTSVPTDVLHLRCKISKVYSFFWKTIFPLNTLLLSALTWNEILLGAVIQIPPISCAHIPYGNRDSSFWLLTLC